MRITYRTRLLCRLLLILPCWTAGCGNDAHQNEGAPASTRVESEKAPEAAPVTTLGDTDPDNAPDSPSSSTGGHPADLDVDHADQLSVSCGRWPVPETDSQIAATLTVRELEREYRSNWKETDAKFAGRSLILSGPVLEVGRNLGGEPVVRLRGSGESFEVACVLSAAESQSKVSKGQTCRLRGVYSASVLPLFLHCELVDSAEPLSTTAEVVPSPAPVTAEHRTAEVTIAAEEYNSDVSELRNEATQKYAGKVVQISGRIARISHAMAGEMFYRLDEPLGAACYLRSGSPWFCLRPGQTVTLVGEGSHVYPCLVNCDIISAGGQGHPTFESKSLAEALETDPVNFRKSHYLQQLIVRGEVSEISSADTLDDEFVITLHGTPSMPIVCRMDDDEVSAAASIQVGDTVTITGWNTKVTPEDSLPLAQCLLWRGD